LPEQAVNIRTISLILLATAAPLGAQSSRAVRIVDDAGITLRLPHAARRIISLIPSATETLIALGAAPQVVGRTDYDVAPEVARVASVGGGIDPSIEAIVALHPDVVIAWDQNKRLRTHEKLIALGIPVVSLRTEDTSDVFRDIAQLGAISGHTARARSIADSIRADFRQVARSVIAAPHPVVFFVLYDEPPMTASPATFVGQLITLAGGRLAFPEHGPLWPTVSMESLVQRAPDVIVLPKGEKGVITLEKLRQMPGWRDLAAVRDGRVVTIPANLVNRPGPRLGDAARALRNAIQSPAVQQAALARAHQ
jgi:iron complex transport system substrate-binding protein